MPRKPLLLSSGSADDAEAEFYEALQRGDVERLMAVWADDDDVACVHPGGPRLIGAVAIRASFDAMFRNGAIDARPDRVRRVETLSTSVHTVIERVRVATGQGAREALVVATNVYVKSAGGNWKLVVHHASQGTPGESDDPAAETASTLH